MRTYFRIVLIIISLLKITLSILNDNIEELSFNLINNIERIPKDLKTESKVTYILSNNITIFKDISINYNDETYDKYYNISSKRIYNTLISTNLSHSVTLLPYNESKNYNEENYNYFLKCPSPNQEAITNSEFNFNGCGPFNTIITQNDITLYQYTYIANQIYKDNCYINYNSILSLQDLENIDMVILDYPNKKIKIIENDKLMSEENEQIFSKMHRCSNGTDGDGKFSCKIDYILFGYENISDDPFLSKKVENGKAYLDNLSTYSIFPYSYLDYFLYSFFSKWNDGCDANPINDSHLYYIVCQKENIDIYSIKRNLSIIIDSYSYSISHLYNETFKLLDIESNNLIFFNILFDSDIDDFILGIDFFIDKEIGFNFIDNSTYIYYKDSRDFSDYFSDDNDFNFKFWIYILTCGAFTLLLIFSTFVNCIHNRKLNKELKDMLENFNPESKK